MNFEMIEYDKAGIDSSQTDAIYLENIANEAILKINEKANNNDSWEFSASSFIIDNFMNRYLNDRHAILNFEIEQKQYACKNSISENKILSSVVSSFATNKNKKNAYKYSNLLGIDNLSKELFYIIMDYIDFTVNNQNTKVVYTQNKNKEIHNLAFNIFENVNTSFITRLKNFERNLLLSLYESKSNDIDNSSMMDIKYASSNVFYVISNQHLFLITYTPTDNQYHNLKLKSANVAPNISFFIYDNACEDYIVNNYNRINDLHKNFIQFTYLSDSTSNIKGIMGEASLVTQHWNTVSINEIMKNTKELNKAKDSSLLAMYITKYILNAEIEGVDTIEVFPVDRVFVFNKSVFSNLEKNNNINIEIYESLLLSKVADDAIKPKEILRQSHVKSDKYAYEWERIKSNLEFNKFNTSKKAVIKTSSKMDTFSKDLIKDQWDNDYNKDLETVLNNLISNLLSSNPQNSTQILEYESKYLNDGITYFYSSGTQIKTEIPIVYELLKNYFNNIEDDKDKQLSSKECSSYFNDLADKDFDNMKIVLFSYTSPDSYGDDSKDFTLLLVAKDDLKKSIMEVQSERDDLNTVLKLLIKQNFTIEQANRIKSKQEQEELIDILHQTKHKIKNSFENFDINTTSVEKLKEKILNIIDQDRVQMEEQGQDAIVKKISNDITSSSLANSFEFLHSLFVSTQDEKKVLNSAFDKNSPLPWDYFANKIFTLKVEDLKNNRIYSTVWTDKSDSSKQLTLKIDFNELQSFTFEYKESLFNDAIYVMLKNSCEHSLETYNEECCSKEIFLDIYISNLEKFEVLNIEFTNNTNPLCKDIYSHINKETTVRNNTNKKNSTGIGVVTIRKRLDVTYGLDTSDIKFTIVNKNKIKSKLYFPIETIENDEVFIDALECQDRDATILYLEDSSEYYKENITKLNEEKLLHHHSERFNGGDGYEKYNLLITDLNIFSPSDDKASVSNGIDAIYTFIEKNENSSVIVLSTDVDEKDILEDLNRIGFKVKELNNKIIILEPRTIYLSKKKEIYKYFINLIKDYETKGHEMVDSGTNEASISARKKKQNSNLYSVVDFDLEGLEEVSQDMINNKLYKSKQLKHIKSWLNIKVTTDIGRDEYVSNSEVKHKFSTKLIIEAEDKMLNNYALVHEAYSKNIVFLSQETYNNKEKIKKMIEYMNTLSIQKKGIFGKISHDILNKMPTFSIYDKAKIETLKEKNNLLREKFEIYFSDFMNSKNGDFKALNKIYDDYLEELISLRNSANDSSIHLGTDIQNINNIISTMKFIKGIKDDI